MFKVLITVMLALAGPAFAADRPNILLIMSDNQSPSLLATYGNPIIKTPHTDRLAREGVLFERAYATSGVCSPSRAVLMTGLIPSANGVHNGLPAAFAIKDYSAIADVRNMPQTLKDAGYTTALVGKYHLGVHETPTLGFDHWVTFRGGHTTSFTHASIFDNGARYDVADMEEHLTDFWTRKAIDYINDVNEAGEPFFLWLSYNGPYMLPPTVNEPPVSRFADMYRENVPPMPQEPLHPFMRDWASDQARSAAPLLDDVVGGRYGWAAIDALNNRNAMINVAAETTHVDDGIGQVLAALEAKGVLDDTLIIFLSDQGSSYGQLGLWGNSSWGDPGPAYNANMQTPLIMRFPDRIPAGLKVDEMINQYDIFPTVLDFAGLGQLEIANSPGKSFVPLLEGKDQQWENEVFFEYISTRVVQTERWKYIKRFLASPNELFDLTNDPEERNNLAGDPAYADVQARLDQRLTTFFAQYADPEFDVWNGGTGKALLYYDRERSDKFRAEFATFKEPFVEQRPAFRD